MSKLNLKNRIKIFKDLILLSEGKLNANTPARQKFLDVHNGNSLPTENWEILFFEWKNAGQPDPEKWFKSGNADYALIGHFQQKRPIKKKAKSVSAFKSKKPRKRKTQAEIARGHKISGYDKKKITFVQGGSVRPR